MEKYEIVCKVNKTVNANKLSRNPIGYYIAICNVIGTKNNLVNNMDKVLELLDETAHVDNRYIKTYF